MLKILLAILLFPCMVFAQEEVKPVISADYLKLIREDSSIKVKAGPVDSISGFSNELKLKSTLPMYIQKFQLKESKGILEVEPFGKTYLAIGGIFTSSAGLKVSNQSPSLQNEFVQGRNLNGQLKWQGPETGEVFSYGPSIHSLEFDGTNYLFDINGRLVQAGSGTGKNALPYNNNILGNGHLFRQSLSLYGRVTKESTQKMVFALKGSTGTEKLMIQNNQNTTTNFDATVEKNIKKYTISAGYNYFHSRFSNNNRNGFLNRVYKDALLTPVSFENAQGLTLPGGLQRSFNNDFDNPLFLLTNNGNNFDSYRSNGNISFYKKYGNLTFNVTQSFSEWREKMNEGTKAGSVHFPGGVLINRQVNNRSNNLSSVASQRIRYGNYKWISHAIINYIFNNEKAQTAYNSTQSSYNYQRATHNLSMSYNTVFDNYKFSTGLNAGNKFYLSNTATQNKFFLPSLNGFMRFSNVFNVHRLSLKLSSNYSSFCNEPRVSSSYATYALTRITPQQVYSFFPVEEVAGFNGLQPVRHNEFSSKLELNYGYRFSFTAEGLTRKTLNEIFPVYENGSLVLKNIADLRNNSFELVLSALRKSNNTKKPVFDFYLSFFKWNNKVTGIKPGYDNLPVAGFSNVYKALVKGQPAGVIVGSSYLKNAENVKIIGSDGFPLVNNNLSVIGNPIPDFTIKSSVVSEWKHFSANLDFEYKKGGEIWNGTKAALDYYGRSETTGIERNTTNYIFNGVLENGQVNNIPVKFYDPLLPINRNRWVRYGPSGIGEAYIEKADAVRINNITLGYEFNFKKYLQKLKLAAHVSNLVLWSAYKGADPNQLLFDQPNSSGLDYFNIPSAKTYGIDLTIQF